MLAAKTARNQFYITTQKLEEYLSLVIFVSLIFQTTKFLQNSWLLNLNLLYRMRGSWEVVLETCEKQVLKTLITITNIQEMKYYLMEEVNLQGNYEIILVLIMDIWIIPFLMKKMKKLIKQY